MFITLINKLLILILVMSCLNTVRHFYYFIQAWVKSDSDNPEKYKVSNSSLWILSLSMGYIITSIICGVFI